MSRAFEKVKEFLLCENIDTLSAIKAQKLSVINERIMPENAKSAVMFLIPYYTGKHEDFPISLVHTLWHDRRIKDYREDFITKGIQCLTFTQRKFGGVTTFQCCLEEFG
ncbi:MAG: hypothetical protein IJ939_02935, partial [Clostridia bacterium]|nr:hypothetical protein [Clostridia bacterium]